MTWRPQRTGLHRVLGECLSLEWRTPSQIRDEAGLMTPLHAISSCLTGMVTHGEAVKSRRADGHPVYRRKP